jgi:hypothetical protein
MEIRRLDPSKRADLRAWLALPFRLYRDAPAWVPPFRGDALMPFSPRNPFYQHSEAAFFGAWDGHQLVGRIAVFENTRYNTYNNARKAFFGLFETSDDQPIAHGLLGASMAWAQRRGLTHLRGPRGFGALDGVGLLVRGFEHRPAMGIPYHLPYYERLLQAEGLEAVEDLLSGRLTRQIEFPDRIHEVSARVMARRGLRIVTYQHKSELRALIPDFMAIYNRSLGLIPDNMPLTEAEVQALADRLLAIAEPRLLKLVFKDDELVGFAFAYPNITRAIQRCHGRLWPLGWAQLLLERRRTDWVDLNGIGIAAEHQGLGGTTILFSEVTKTLLEERFQYAELVQMRLHNDKMAREMSRIDVDWYKTHRIFERAL